MIYAVHRRRLFERNRPDRPMSWERALVLMALVTSLIWVVQIVNHLDHQHLDRFGLRPRHVDGLGGIITMPLLHTGFWVLLTETAPFLMLGWGVLLSGIRIWAVVTGTVVVLGGVLAWLSAPDALIVGCSGLIFGWFGYLLARAWFSRKFVWIIGAVCAGVFFSSLLASLLPHGGSQANWVVHLCGFAAGVFAGWLLHPPTRKSRKENRKTQRKDKTITVRRADV